MLFDKFKNRISKNYTQLYSPTPTTLDIWTVSLSGFVDQPNWGSVVEHVRHALGARFHPHMEKTHDHESDGRQTGRPAWSAFR